MNAVEGARPISLGRSCAAKFQIARNLYARLHAGDAALATRRAISASHLNQVIPSHLFDFQITPIEALIRYLEQDFAGVFELQDLFVNWEGVATHRSLMTEHPHNFRLKGQQDPAAALESQFPAAKARFEHLANRFRAHLASPGRFLYIVEGAEDDRLAMDVRDLLRRGHRDHDAQLLWIVRGRSLSAPAEWGPGVWRAALPPTITKASEDAWEGDDADWETVLAAFPIPIIEPPPFSPTSKPKRSAAPLEGEPLPLGWFDLPGATPRGAAPLTVATPALAWDYGAMSEPIDGAGASGSLVVDVEAVEGLVGLALAAADGSRILSPEFDLSPMDGRVLLRFALHELSAGPRLLVRNYGLQGVAGRAVVHEVRRR